MFIILKVTEHIFKRKIKNKILPAISSIAVSILQICVISINGKTSNLMTSVKKQDITTDSKMSFVGS